MSTNHTPGPWIVNGSGELEIGGHSTGTAAAGFSDGVINYPEAFANLTLAAAAPDLLEALKGLLMMPPKYRAASEEMARAAIAKAEGR